MRLFFKKRILFPLVFGLAFYFFFRANYEVPILMYHCVGHPTLVSKLNMSPEMFARQMEFLKMHNYNVISLLDLIQLMQTHQKIPFNTVVITLDDGTLDNVKNAYPILKKLDLKATIFMITDRINNPGWLSEEDLRILETGGVAIGSHTASHAFLPELTREEILDEVRLSRNKLEKILGHPIFLFSYPAGGVTQSAKDLLVESGYQGAVTTNYGNRHDDPYALHRIKITGETGGLLTFWLKTSGLYHLGKKRLPLK